MCTDSLLLSRGRRLAGGKSHGEERDVNMCLFPATRTNSAQRKLIHARDSLAASALVLRLLLRVALEDDEEAHKDAHEINEELKGVRHEVPPPAVCIFDDHLRVKDDVAHEHEEATVQFHGKETRRKRSAHEEIEHPTQNTFAPSQHPNELASETRNGNKLERAVLKVAANLREHSTDIAEPRMPPRYRKCLLFATNAAAEKETKIIVVPADETNETSV